MPLVGACRNIILSLQTSESRMDAAAPHPRVCQALLRLALDKCVVTEDADCAHVLRLYHQHGCNVHAAAASAGEATTPMDFIAPF